MIDHPATRVLAVLGAMIGLLTGLGTIVGWIVSDDFGETAFTAVQVAGYAYLAAVIVASLTWAVREWTGLTRIVVVVALVILAGPWVLVSAGSNEDWEWYGFVMGCIGIPVATVYVIGYGIGERRAYARSRKSCPDCAETIKSAARVCRYCGYRFESP